MPIYEYYCTSCGHEFEVLQKITDNPIRKCDHCGKLKAKRAISKTSFVLKGTGWYVTDYGGANASRHAETMKSDTDPKKSDSEPKADKTDPKAASKKVANG